MSFGGKTWPINAQDMNLGRVSTGSDICAGGIFDLNAGSSIDEGGGNPSWVVGATFLKNVYSVFRSKPAAIGFAELSSAAGGSSGECCSFVGHIGRETFPSQQKISTDSGSPPVVSHTSTSTSTRSSGTPASNGTNNGDGGDDGDSGTGGQQPIIFYPGAADTNLLLQLQLRSRSHSR